jgi:hypothetical protein
MMPMTETTKHYIVACINGERAMQLTAKRGGGPASNYWDYVDEDEIIYHHHLPAHPADASHPCRRLLQV